MIAELLNSVSSDIVVGMAQAACAIAICLAVVILYRRFAVHVERETITSLARGLVQMVAVGVRIMPRCLENRKGNLSRKGYSLRRHARITHSRTRPSAARVALQVRSIAIPAH